ncbi:hypothetical protein ABH916_000298 [Peribacillus frigoritolerans]
MSMMLQSPEDYYERWIPGTFIRIRYLAAILALFTPSLYIAFISFHSGMIPTKLAISIIGTKAGTKVIILDKLLYITRFQNTININFLNSIFYLLN